MIPFMSRFIIFESNYKLPFHKFGYIIRVCDIIVVNKCLIAVLSGEIFFIVCCLMVMYTNL
jgi:hypothetical protein